MIIVFQLSTRLFASSARPHAMHHLVRGMHISGFGTMALRLIPGSHLQPSTICGY